jgi:two-component system, NarL family, sensor kinase
VFAVSVRSVDRGTWTDPLRPLLLVVTFVASIAAATLSPVDRLALVGIAGWLAVTAFVGFVLAGRVRTNPVGWLLLATTATVAVHLVSTAYVLDRIAGGVADAPGVSLATWLVTWLLIPGLGLFGFVLLVFPTGRLPSPWWRTIAMAGGAALVAGSAAMAFRPGPVDGIGLDNPFGWEGREALLAAVLAVAEPVSVLFGIGAVLSLAVRYRGSEGDERQQVRWLTFAAVVLAGCAVFAAFASGPLNDASFVAGLIGLTGVPVAIGVAVLRYRLYDLGALVNRTAVYATLSLAVTGVYVTTVVVAGTALNQAAGLIASLLATLLVAATFQPLRTRIQQLVDRVMYGERRDPYGVLVGLARRLQSGSDPTSVPELVVTTLHSTLGLAYAAVEIVDADGTRLVATRGKPVDDAERVPVVYQDELVGNLVYARPAGPAARGTARLLDDVADQVASALQGVRLTAALQRSRERLVLAREEERRRLRGDLHDSLGPELAGITMGLEATENLLATDLAAATEALGSLRERARQAVGTVRSVVDGLRPPTLDDLGLAESVRRRATTLHGIDGPHVEVIVEGETERLPAAVEVAAYYIAVEGLTNAIRHGNASSIVVQIDAEDGRLRVTVQDDGCGMVHPARDGAYGLQSMRERAAELGGSLVIDSGPAGTTLAAVLPVTRTVA